ncbi:MAG: hypothetical protein ABW150_06700, partial [Candidatus Thiodiazotropha sp.]
AFGAGIILFLVPAFSSCQYRQMDEISGLGPFDTNPIAPDPIPDSQSLFLHSAALSFAHVE